MSDVAISASQLQEMVTELFRLRQIELRTEQLREQIEKLRRDPRDMWATALLYNSAIDDVLAILNSQQEKS